MTSTGATRISARPESGAALAPERLEVMMGDGGVHDCGNAQNCVEVCPKSLLLTDAIADVGRQVTVVLNGRKVIDKGEIEGLTAIASDANEGQPGPLILQGDHGPVEFRAIVLTPLVK